jgi:inner membrane protein
MDPISHAIVGGTAAALLCRTPQRMRVAVLCGVVAGMAPDMDVLIQAQDDPMFGLGYHRFFTHALAFAPFGALLVAAFLWLFLREKLPLKHV